MWLKWILINNNKNIKNINNHRKSNNKNINKMEMKMMNITEATLIKITIMNYLKNNHFIFQKKLLQNLEIILKIIKPQQVNILKNFVTNVNIFLIIILLKNVASSNHSSNGSKKRRSDQNQQQNDGNTSENDIAPTPPTPGKKVSLFF